MSQFDPLDTHAQEKLKAVREEQLNSTKRIEAEDFKWLMSDKRGRRIVWGLLEKTGIYQTSFTGNSETFFREGARNIGLVYFDLLNKNCPERYTLMVTEQREHDNRNADNGRNKH